MPNGLIRAESGFLRCFCGVPIPEWSVFLEHHPLNNLGLIRAQSVFLALYMCLYFNYRMRVGQGIWHAARTWSVFL